MVLLEKKLNDLNICLTIIESEGFSFDQGHISNLAAKNNIDKEKMKAAIKKSGLEDFVTPNTS